MKLYILRDSKAKAGIYRLTHKESEKSYVGSAKDLKSRMTYCFNLKYLERRIKVNKSLIYRALQKHGYSAFSLYILEYCDLSTLLEREQHYIDNLEHMYNILQFAYSRKGLKHTKASIELIKKSHANSPVLSEQDKASNSANRTAASPTAQTVKVTHNVTRNTQSFLLLEEGQTILE